jgi:putative phosphoribosyl transferase
MIFEDRVDAGRRLAKWLESFAGRADVSVLGVPRGGVVVAYEVAAALGAPLDVFLSRKLGVPGQPELAFGAVSANGERYLDEYILRTAAISANQVDWITAEVREELDRRAAVYREDRPPLDVSAKTVILVDDGVATGASVLRGDPGVAPVTASPLSAGGSGGTGVGMGVATVSCRRGCLPGVAAAVRSRGRVLR